MMLGLLLSAAPLLAWGPACDPTQWDGDHDRAMEAARRESRAAVLYFSLPLDATSHETFIQLKTDPRLVDAMDRTVRIILEEPDLGIAYGRYRISELPALAVLDPGGALVDVITITPHSERWVGQFLAALREAHLRTAHWVYHPPPAVYPIPRRPRPCLAAEPRPCLSAEPRPVELPRLSKPAPRPVRREVPARSVAASAVATPPVVARIAKAEPVDATRATASRASAARRAKARAAAVKRAAAKAVTRPDPGPWVESDPPVIIVEARASPAPAPSPAMLPEADPVPPSAPSRWLQRVRDEALKLARPESR